MCDTLCVIGSGRTLFAKNSDRPPGEVQVVESHDRRLGEGLLDCQYLRLDDAGAVAIMGSRPTWLWGFEHGVNEHRVAIGNEKIYTTDDPYAADPALIGMDLVRLGLERAENAEDAVAIMTKLLEHHGQGGVADRSSGEPYFSSFLVADPRDAWILETSGATWAAKPVDGSAAISNRITLGTDWEKGSADLEPGADFDRYRSPEAPTAHADVRLAVSRDLLAAADALTPEDLVAHLRHHGDRPWGAPGMDPSDVSPPPDEAMPDGTGISVCMHVRSYQATTSSMVAELPEDPGAPLRAWMALGSPCTSVFVPVFPPHGVPAELASEENWRRFSGLRERVESDPQQLSAVREVLGPLESDLWQEADGCAGEVEAERRFASLVWSRVEAALDELS